jgi:hypothetical protein
MSFSIFNTAIYSSILNIELNSAPTNDYSNLSSDIIPANSNINLGSSDKVFSELYTGPGSILFDNFEISTSGDSAIVFGDSSSKLSILDGNINLGSTIISSDEYGNIYLPTKTQIGQISPGQLVILGSYLTVEDLNSILSPNIGDSYIIKSFTPSHLFTCTYNIGNVVWTDAGAIEGPQGPIGDIGVDGPPGYAGGIFSLVTVQIPGINSAAGNPILSNSIQSNSIAGVPWNGRVQSINGYSNLPVMLSFTINCISTNLGSGDPLSLCAIGFSSNPTNLNTNDYSGYFDAGFLVSLAGPSSTSIQIIYNSLPTPINITASGPYTNDTSVFSIVFDGDYFNYFVNNRIVATTPRSPIAPTAPLLGPSTYYFTYSFPGGVSPPGIQVNVNNIVFAPYSSLNPRVSSGNLQNTWRQNSNSVLCYLDINNTFVIPSDPTEYVGIKSILNLGSTNPNSLQGFIFSFVAFIVSTTTSNNVFCQVIDQFNPSNSYVRLMFSNYTITMSVNGQQLLTPKPYTPGDIIQIVYDPSTSPPTTTIYQNQISIGSTTSFTPSSAIPSAPAESGCIASIVNRAGQTTILDTIRVINPMFSAYGPISSSVSASFMLAGGSVSNGLTNTLAYSNDKGVTWNAVTGSTGIFPTIVSDVFFNNNIWVATGAGTVGTNNPFQLAYSYDGLNWIGSSQIFSPNGVGLCLAWNGSYWLCGGEVVIPPTQVGSIVLVTSKDGIIWTNTTGNIGSLINACTSICWNGSLWVASGPIASSGTTQVIYSIDGVNWIKSISGTAIGFQGISTIIWNGSIFLAVGGSFNSPTSAISSDGIIWTNPVNSGPFGYGSISSVAWNGILFMACGNNGDGSFYILATSPDGINWTKISIIPPFADQQLKTVIWNSYISRWIIAGIPSQQVGSTPLNIVAYSDDVNGAANNWTLATNNALGSFECFAARTVN